MLLIASEIASDIGVPNDCRAQENNEFSLSSRVIAVLEQVTEQWDSRDARNRGVVVLESVFHEPTHYGDISVRNPNHRIHFAGADDRNLVLDIQLFEVGIGVVRPCISSRDTWPNIQNNRLTIADLRRYVQYKSNRN